MKEQRQGYLHRELRSLLVKRGIEQLNLNPTEAAKKADRLISAFHNKPPNMRTSLDEFIKELNFHSVRDQ